MRLLELLERAGLQAGREYDLHGRDDAEVQRLSDDSRRVDPSTMFVATAQGQKFVEQVATTGVAPVLLVPAELTPLASRGKGAVLIARTDLLALQGLLAATLCGHASRKMEVIGVTGTNGKTSVTHMLYHIWSRCHRPAALVGTLGVRYRDALGREHVEQTGYTTPRAPELQSLLRRFYDNGVRHVAMEVSSEAIRLGRIEGTSFAAGIFTNLTPDHLDFHGSMEQYYLSKRVLFERCLAAGARMIVAAGDAFGERLINEMRAAGAGDRLLELREPFVNQLPAPTEFNRWNASLAVLALESGGISRSEACLYLADLPAIPGRFELVGARGQPWPEVFGVVDYAHSPDALEKALVEARNLNIANLVVVFGCGGDRDRKKRPLMGAVAARLADQVVICDDNPRTEDASQIRSEILAGARSVSGAAELIELGSRRAAIREGVAIAVRSRHFPALVLVAGKGHEEYQIFRDRREPFSDRTELEQALLERPRHES